MASYRDKFNNMCVYIHTYTYSRYCKRRRFIIDGVTFVLMPFPEHLIVSTTYTGGSTMPEDMHSDV